MEPVLFIFSHEKKWMLWSFKGTVLNIARSWFPLSISSFLAADFYSTNYGEGHNGGYLDI